MPPFMQTYRLVDEIVGSVFRFMDAELEAKIAQRRAAESDGESLADWFLDEMERATEKGGQQKGEEERGPLLKQDAYFK